MKNVIAQVSENMKLYILNAEMQINMQHYFPSSCSYQNCRPRDAKVSNFPALKVVDKWQTKSLKTKVKLHVNTFQFTRLSTETRTEYSFISYYHLSIIINIVYIALVATIIITEGLWWIMPPRHR